MEPLLTIVGGTYREYCDEPHWAELYGSGLRAAVAVSARIAVPHLVTYCDADTLPDLQLYAGSAGIGLTTVNIARTLRFTYDHPLARPEIQPALLLVQPAAPLRVQARALLRFGMLDGDAVVDGERVVYDPQSAYRPAPFAENGSRAAMLAIVANVRETLALAGEPPTEHGRRSEDTIRGAARRLLADGASVVVVKRGARGASVFEPATPDGVVVPAFYARTVWPIGSGDVFAAVFAEQWAVRGHAAPLAAHEASAATARYCASQVLPIAPDLSTGTEAALQALSADDESRTPRVYLAGPFFSMAQRWLVRETRNALQDHGLSVFSPFHDVGIGPAEVVVHQDVAELEICDILLALVDGADPGTLFEIGYARKRGIPVVAFAQHETPEALKMLVGTGCEIRSDFTSAIYHVAWIANGHVRGSVPASRA